MRVAARIHQPDADERHAEVARFLAVIAGDDAEAGAVERQRLVEGELRTHAGDRLRDTRHAPRPPRARARANDVQRGDGRVEQPQVLRIARGMIETLGFDQMQQQHRVVIGEPPQRIVEIPENLARLRVPAPPQVVGQLVEAANPGRQGRERDVPVHVGRRNYQPQSQQRKQRTDSSCGKLRIQLCYLCSLWGETEVLERRLGCLISGTTVRFWTYISLEGSHS